MVKKLRVFSAYKASEPQCFKSNFTYILGFEENLQEGSTTDEHASSANRLPSALTTLPPGPDSYLLRIVRVPDFR
jgi:hypothetical protein